MNQAQRDYEMCKRVARDNTRCLSILMKILGKDRADIIDQIAEVNKVQFNSISPEGIVKMYESHGEDIDKFIAEYDKAMNNAKYIRKNFYDGYEKGMEDYLNG